MNDPLDYENQLPYLSLYQTVRGLAKRLQDISYQISEIEKESKYFPEGKERNNRAILFAFYLELIPTLENIIENLKESKQKFNKIVKEPYRI